MCTRIISALFVIEENCKNSQWLGLHTLTSKNQVQSLVKELRSQKPCGTTKKKKKKRGKLFYWKRTPCPSKRDQLAKSWFIHIMKANCFKKKKKKKTMVLMGKGVQREKYIANHVSSLLFCKTGLDMLIHTQRSLQWVDH